MVEFEPNGKKNTSFKENNEFSETGRFGGKGTKKHYTVKQNLSQSIKSITKGLAVATAGFVIAETAVAFADPAAFMKDINAEIGSEPSPSSIQELIAATDDHIWSDEGVVIKESTCKEKGILRFFCKICDATKDEDMELAEHSASEDEGTEASCTESGHTGTVVCSVCGEVLDEGEDIAPLGHNFGPEFVALAPTCTATGLRRIVCLRCGVQQDTIIAALGHNWGPENIVTEPTCTAEGLKRVVCLRCGERIDTAIAALGHTPGELINAIEPTCLEAGLDELHCAVCDEVIESHEVAALGHDSGETVVISEASCTTDGVIHLVCGRCGEVLGVSASMALGHLDDNADIRCDRCGKVLLSVAISGGSHSGYDAVAQFSIRMEDPAVFNTETWVSLYCEDYLTGEVVQNDGSADFTVYLYAEADNPDSEWYFQITVFVGHDNADQIITQRFVLDDHFIVSNAD